MLHQQPQASLQALFAQQGVLLVVREAGRTPKPAPRQPGLASDYQQPYDDVFLALLASGEILAFNGHVDLGTGIRTALAQIVAEELYLPLERVKMVLGHTSATPNQGPTIASATIQISAVPLRQAAANAREFLRQKAAEALACQPDQLRYNHLGGFVAPDGQTLAYERLLEGQHYRVEHTDDVALKPMADYRIIGRSTSRVDIPAKATGQLMFVHDVRVPDMWHARVVRPPYVGRDCGEFIGNSLISIDRSSVKGIPGPVEVVQIADFVAVAAPREEHAIQAAKALKIEWRTPKPLQPLDDLEQTLRNHPYEERLLVEQQDASPTVQAGVRLERSYLWPFQMHASIGPSCSVADFQTGHVRVWSASQNPHMLRIELSRLLDLPEGDIEIIRMEGSGCYGRNCADDVGADAALISRAIGRPVRVQLSREQEHGWEPKGAAQLIDITGEADTDGQLYSYDFVTRYPSNDAPTLALLLTGVVPAEPRILEMGDRTAVPPYNYPNMRLVCHDMPAIVRSAWLRGVSALPNSFAHDSFIDELAYELGEDPVEYRIRFLKEERARLLMQEIATHAGWQRGHQGSRGLADHDGWLHGRGVAYARYTHSRFPGFGAAWSAWVIDLSVHAQTGRVVVRRVVVGQDTGMMINPAGVRHQVQGNVIQMLSRTLKEAVAFGPDGVVDLEWGAYPLIRFTEIPPIDVLLLDRQDQPPMGAGESASVPGPAAIANALFDATGVRFRQAPFTAEKIMAAIQPQPAVLA